MNNKRIIKKYPNRRLYDTEDSIYITLENIRELVIKNKEFIVKDVKTDKPVLNVKYLKTFKNPKVSTKFNKNW